MKNSNWRRWLETPKSLLLIDSLGALGTFSFTAFLLAPSWIPTGLPTIVLILLSLVAFGYFLIGQYGYYSQSNHRPTLRLMAVLNSIYCLSTIGLCIIHRSTLTAWGAIYFSIEILIVFVLVGIEWRLSNTGRDDRKT